MTKKQFRNLLLSKNIKISHLSYRQFDYKYHEYKLYMILSKYIGDFSVLCMPVNLNIKKNPNKDEYDIDRRSPVTLNTELYKFYRSGYFKNDDHFMRYVTIVMNKYKNENFTINKLVKITRRKRLQYERQCIKLTDEK